MTFAKIRITTVIQILSVGIESPSAVDYEMHIAKRRTGIQMSNVLKVECTYNSLKCDPQLNFDFKFKIIYFFQIDPFWRFGSTHLVEMAHALRPQFEEYSYCFCKMTHTLIGF